MESDLEAALSPGQLEEFLETGIMPADPAAPTPISTELAGRISWRRVLEAMADFLPDGGALFSRSREMYEDFASRELLRPLPAELKPALRAQLAELSEAEFSALSLVSEPLWKILGTSAPPASAETDGQGRLAREHHLLVALSAAC